MQLYGICRRDIGDGPTVYAHLYASASPARRARAERCRHPEDAWRCLLAEALLRRGLADAGCPAAADGEVTVATGAYGKPHIVGCPDFHYNLSHGGDWVVLAWDGSPVGVDVEPVDGTRNVRALAARYFSADEQAYMEVAASAVDAAERFYALWTAKEAYLKYVGTGLGQGMTTPPVVTDGCIGDGVYLSRRRLPDGHWLAVCGAQPLRHTVWLTAEDLTAKSLVREQNKQGR